tara:strand:+ start:882 stop:1277 length:396 start_codon:yes stop_codon:yes gene_type:complete
MGEKTFDIKLRSEKTVTVKLGSKLMMSNCNVNRRGNNRLMELTVTKIGHKWVTFEYGHSKYYFDAGACEKSNYGHNTLHESQETYDDMIEAEKLYSKFRRELSSFGRMKYSKSQITEAAYILGIDLYEKDE